MSALVQYEPLVNEVIQLFLERTRSIYAAPGKACDFALWLQYFAFDVIGQITYSKQHGFVDKNEDIDGMIAYLGRLFSYVAPVRETTVGTNMQANFHRLVKCRGLTSCS